MTASESGTASKGRLILARTLVVLGLVVGAISLFSSYVNWQVFDEDTFEETSAALIADDEIRAQLAASIAQQFFANVDVQAELEARLPADQKGLSGPITGALRQLGDQAANRLLERPRVQALFIAAALQSQRLAKRALSDDLRGVETRDGKLVLDLREAVTELGDEFGFLGNVADRLPEDVGVIVIAEVDQFETAQELTEVFRKIAVVLPFIALALMGAGILLARGRRRRELRAVAIGFVLVGVLVLVLRRVAGRIVVGDLSPSPSTDDAVDHAWRILTALLADGAWSVIILGITAFIGLWLSAESGLGARVRYALGPVLARRLLAYSAGVLLLLLMIWWQPTAQFGRPLSLITYAVLLAIGIELLGALVRREDPEAATADPIQRLRGIRLRDEPATVSTAAAAATASGPTESSPGGDPDGGAAR
ncbi:MAG: hypothetical protein ACRC50_08700 [Gaiella sp.]